MLNEKQKPYLELAEYITKYYKEQPVVHYNLDTCEDDIDYFNIPKFYFKRGTAMNSS